MVVTFLSDFGLDDHFVGVCHGVMKRIAPAADVIDLTHGIPAQDVLDGAFVLAQALPYMPAGVHLAVVDPGVGTERRAVVVRGGDRLYVGPDNGLLVPAAERLGGIEAAFELTNPAYRLEPVSATFHGRDLFAPAAAHLARGVEPTELGPEIRPETLVRLELPEPELARGRIRATTLHVDRFGNLHLNVTRQSLEQAGVELDVVRTFASAEPGEIVYYEDSSGWLAIAVVNGNASRTLAIGRGEELWLPP